MNHAFNKTMIDAMEGLAGRHPGYRRAHARGFILDAVFKPNGAAAPLTTAPHLQRESVPAVVRFSHTSGDPSAPDAAPTVRGLAVKFLIPGSGEADIVAVNVPAFVASTPPNFLELVERLTDAGPERQAAVAAFVSAHPESMRAFTFASAIAIPVSYATSQFWATHSFGWVGPGGERRFVRYTWEPALGVQTVEPAVAISWTPTHHTEELLERLKSGPVRFTLRVQFAGPGDPIDDSTQLWPEDRPQLDVGTLEITHPSADAAAWDATTFDPTRVGPGIEVSADPVLLARSALYDESQARRRRERQ
ncbi:catalase family peroxidase [Kutzneria sp. NPDC052558]|uniref:catalase family peroxidase n=1 Tax=Kutzneria sp. NPDC052558 TaxID=3364121 RepID=UPI0037CB0357